VKHVRVLACAAGLAPAAFCLALTPVAAQAATASGAGRAAKTVSLHPLTRTGAAARGAAAAASSIPVSSAGAGTVSPDSAGCAGHTPFTVPVNSTVKGHGWYTDPFIGGTTCIGTVVVSLYFKNDNCKQAFLKITDPPDGQKFTAQHQVCGQAGHWADHAFPVHSSFGEETVRVSLHSTYGHNTTYTVRP
jgi:hypothetical protein